MSQTATITAESIPASKSLPYRTCLVPNPEFVPPKEFTFPDALKEVPLNGKGPTEVPVKTEYDYSREDVVYKYKDFLPYNTLTSEEPLAPYAHADVAAKADPEKKALLNLLAGRKDITPNIGTEIRDVQLSKFTEQQKDELALYVAERGLVIFRDQDFIDHGAGWMKEFGSYFGRLHVHQWGTHPKDQPELTVVFRDSNKGNYFDNQTDGSVNTPKWHWLTPTQTDMSYEKNPPCTTFLCAVETPECGGDTLYANVMTAYDRLSPKMQAFVETLEAVHSGTRQNQTSTKTNLVRRPALDTVHPVVRKHPVTGRKALWVNSEYCTKIVGLKQEESDAILTFLLDHIAKGIDFQTRVKWEPGTVVVYDNRMVQHSITLDYPVGGGGRRHLIRVTPQGECPSI